MRIACLLLMVSLLAGCAALPGEEAPLILTAQIASEETVLLAVQGEEREIARNEYIACVVAAEMPASWPTEALKAQAVAARSFAAHRLSHGGTLCDDSGHCQAFLPKETLRERWGKDFDRYWDKVSLAAEETQGLILTYEGEPLLAFYHASSQGCTENGADAFSTDLPCFASVSSPEDAPCRQKEYTYDEMAQALSRYTGKSFTAKAASDLTVLAHTDTGRIKTVQISETRLTGKELRFALGLSSTAITLESTENGIRFTSYGSGHGVGMSQLGARDYAREGWDYEQILAHYYPGSALEKSA